MLNKELGIPCDTASNYYNATGFSRQMIEKAKQAAAEAAAAEEAEMNKIRQYVMRGFGNDIVRANSIEGLNAAIEKLAQEKRNVGGGGFTGIVTVFGKTFRKGITPTTCPTTDAECNRRTLAAIREFEANYKSIVEERRKQIEDLIKQETQVKQVAERKAKPMDYPPPMPPNVIPNITPTPMPSVEEQGGTVGGGAEAGAANTPKDMVLIAGKQIKKSTLIFGAVGLGIVGLLFYKLR